MANQPKKPTPKSEAGTGLQRKVGPFPVWAWGAVAVGGYYLYKKNGTGTAATTSSTTTGTSVSPTTGTSVSPTTGYSSDGSSTGGSGTGGGVGNGGGSFWNQIINDKLLPVPGSTVNQSTTPVSPGGTSMTNPVTQTGGTVGPTEIATTGGTVSTTNPNLKGYSVTGAKGTVVLGGALNNGVLKLSSPAQVKAAKAAGVTVGAGNTVKIPSK